MSTLAYPKWVVNDDHLDATEREFILLSVSWLDDLSRQQHPQRFLGLPNAERQAMLAQISRSDAGENWLSTLLLYIFEALLTDPVNGGNPNGIGRQ